MMEMVEIIGVTVLSDFIVRLKFSDNTEKDVNLAPLLCGRIFEPIRRDPAMFRSVKVDPEIGTIVWPNGADIDPDVLRYDLTPAWMEPEAKTA